MTTGALIMMILTKATVTAITGYMFWRVLRTPPQPGEDSYAEE
jgi:hypothetical protein